MIILQVDRTGKQCAASKDFSLEVEVSKYPQFFYYFDIEDFGLSLGSLEWCVENKVVPTSVSIKVVDEGVSFPDIKTYFCVSFRTLCEMTMFKLAWT